MGKLNINEVCGKILKDARISKNMSVEDVAFYLLPKKEDKVFSENNGLEEFNGTEFERKAKDVYERKEFFQNVEMEKLYKENIKKINYWEKGNGFPDLSEIYKLAEIIEIDPNEIYKYRETGRKNLKGEKRISKWKYYRNRVIDDNLESLKLLFPALVGAVVIWFLFKGMTIIDMISAFIELLIARNS